MNRPTLWDFTMELFISLGATTDLEEEIVDAYLVSLTGLKHSNHLIRIFENNTDKLCDWLLLGQCDCFFRIMKIIQIN